MPELQKLKITQALFWRNVFNSHRAVRRRALERERQREEILNYWQLSRMSRLTILVVGQVLVILMCIV